LRASFPRSLDGAPMLLPLEGGAVRRALDAWFEAKHVKPRVVGEFEDTALLKTVAQDGLGVFTAPSAVEREVRRQYGVRAIGRTSEIKEHFYAISIERRLKTPAVVAI